MESQKTQIKDAAQPLDQSVDNSVSNEQHQPVKKSRKLRPFAVMGS
ncbi:MAG: hypothetical protein F6J92_40290 [Symploca sp. SIO1A3]|nr:hypothetical protein [Symploca sp. SIO1A3]